METTLLSRTGSGRFHFPSIPADHHHDLPVLSRTRSAGSQGLSPRPRSTNTVHLELTRDHHQVTRGVPLPNTLRRTSSCDSVNPASSSSFHRNSRTTTTTTTLPPHVLSLGSPARRPARPSSTTKSSALVDEDLELEFAGGGSGRGNSVGGGGRRPGGGSGDHGNEMGAYYKEMIQADPENPLLLMNYGKYLHDVQGDLEGAEDCFGRAVLANPTDGEALSLYGKLMWEAHRDEQRADDYLQRAVQAAPEDCYVLASYAHFLWDADEEEEKDDVVETAAGSAAASSSSGNNAVMVKAY